jgi:hypothetical protein
MVVFLPRNVCECGGGGGVGWGGGWRPPPSHPPAPAAPQRNPPTNPSNKKKSLYMFTWSISEGLLKKALAEYSGSFVGMGSKPEFVNV